MSKENIYYDDYVTIYQKYTDCCGAFYDEDVCRCPECGELCGYYEDE